MIADDHVLLRQGLKQIIELEEDMKVIYQASDGEEAYEIAKKISPDIILMDINMPNINGIKAAKMLKNDNPKNKIMFLTIYNDKEYLMEALKIGVEGYI
nr:response regulator transcription factor [Thermoanaerobacterium thermosaccharolyticum]